jgi:hypothetical protein
MVLGNELDGKDVKKLVQFDIIFHHFTGGTEENGKHLR